MMMDRRKFLATLGAGAAMLAGSGGLVQAQSRYESDALIDGAVISLRCLGHIRTRTVFLDGRTLEASVGLAPGRGGNFSGALWRVSRIGSDVVALNCQGHLDGPRWLDGRTQNGTVGLAPDTRGGYTGTRWRVRSLDRDNPDVIALECLGDIPGNRWLDGRTQSATVGLSPHTGSPYTGTAWRIES
jgi:hypothetical protein